MRAFWTVVMAACLAATQADASDTGASDRDTSGLQPVFSEQSWNQRDGLPQSTVTGIVSNPDGTLLLSTFAGLATFDGQRAVPLDTAGPFARVSQLTLLREHETTPGNAWIGTVGAGLWQRSGSILQPLQPTSLQHATVWDVDERGGQLLVSSDAGGFLRSSDGRWSQITETSHWGRLGASGDRWLCGADNHVVHQTASGKETQLVLPEGELCQTGIVDPDGDFWILGRRTLFLADASGSVTPAVGLPLHVGWGQSPHLDSDGQLWVGARDSVLALGPWQAVKKKVLAGTRLQAESHSVGVPRSWFNSGSGALWVGTVGEGLVRLTPLGFSRLRDSPKRGSRGAGPVHGSGQTVWYTTDCSDLQVEDATGGHLRVPLPTQPSDGQLCIDALWADDHHALAIRGQHLLRGSRAGLELIDDAPWSPNDRPTAVERGTDGSAWLGTDSGKLWTLDGDTLRPAEPPPPLGMGSVLDLLFRADGSLAVAHATGLCLLENAAWTCWSEVDGLAVGPVRHLHEDETGRLWYASYGGGLGWLDHGGLGRIATDEMGISDRFLSSVLDDGKGSLWLQGNAGVTRVQLADLRRNTVDPSIPLRTELIDVGESNGYLRHSAALLDNGRAWLAGVGGISVVDTRSFRSTVPTGPPLLRTAAVGDHALDPTAVSNRAPPDAFRRLEVQYAAPGLEQGRVWFEHRLVRGTEEANWVEAGGTRTAIYTGLLPGHHRFEVRKVGLDGKRSPVASLAFSVAPMWWESWIVRVAGLILLFVALSVLLTVRNRGVSRRALALQAEVTRRTEAEKRLLAREARFRQVFDQSVNGFVLHAPDGTCIAANPSACLLFGLDEETLLRTPRSALGLPDLPQGGSAEPLLCTRANGDHFAARIDEVTYQSESGPRVLTSLVDLTALFDAQNKERNLRRQLSSALRLEALGRLSGGIAHDMNNVLAAISNNVELLGELTSEAGLGPDAEISLCLNDARSGVDRGSSMIRQLLAFSQKETVATEAVEPEEVLRSMERMLIQLLPEDRSLAIVSQPVGRVQMNPTELEQVILNLVLNASDAVPPEGAVRLLLSPGPDPDTVLLAVEDDGSGIEDDAMEHLFEPFYTTKPQGQGTGLGLPTVKSVVEKAGGTIAVRTGPHGTRFEVLLPTENGVVQAPQPTPPPTRGDGSVILLVDDDSGVRRSVRRQLTRAGWTVEDYRDPLEARERILSDAPPPALLVTDVLMPGLNGRQLAKIATLRHPSLKVLFVSGYTGDVLGQDSSDGHPLLAKPFQRETLLHTIHRLVTEGRRDTAEGPTKAAQA